jgi:FAD/FMN-containing dehydrogenase
VADVSAAVRWAVDSDLPISVRCGGHSIAGHGVGNGSLMLDLARIKTVTVDLASRIADAGGGAKLEDLDQATTAHGLAAPSGTYADTGIGGIFLGGGISYLIGTRGFACDAMVGAELVTADGSIVEVDAVREPELLWALRGGGGNFGVVTRFRVALEPLGPVFGGRIRFAGPRMRELTEQVFDLQAAAPDELALDGVLFVTMPSGGRRARCSWPGRAIRASPNPRWHRYGAGQTSSSTGSLTCPTWISSCSATAVAPPTASTVRPSSSTRSPRA